MRTSILTLAGPFRLESARAQEREDERLKSPCLWGRAHRRRRGVIECYSHPGQWAGDRKRLFDDLPRACRWWSKADSTLHGAPHGLGSVVGSCRGRGLPFLCTMGGRVTPTDGISRDPRPMRPPRHRRRWVVNPRESGRFVRLVLSNPDRRNVGRVLEDGRLPFPYIMALPTTPGASPHDGSTSS